MACCGAQQRLDQRLIAAIGKEEEIGDIAMKGVVKSPTQLLVQSTQISLQAEWERCYWLWFMKNFLLLFLG